MRAAKAESRMQQLDQETQQLRDSEAQAMQQKQVLQDVSAIEHCDTAWNTSANATCHAAHKVGVSVVCIQGRQNSTLMQATIAKHFQPA